MAYCINTVCPVYAVICCAYHRYSISYCINTVYCVYAVVYFPDDISLMRIWCNSRSRLSQR